MVSDILVLSGSWGRPWGVPMVVGVFAVHGPDVRCSSKGPGEMVVGIPEIIPGYLGHRSQGSNGGRWSR